MLSLLLLPMPIFYFGFSSSMALGTTVAAMAIVLLAAGRPRHLANTARRLRSPSARTVLQVLAALCVLVVLHLALASLMLPIQWDRALASLIPLALLAAGGAALARMLEAAPPAALHRALIRCFLAFCVIALLGAAGVSPPTFKTFSKPVFPFTEPSHFALTFSPLLLYVSVMSASRWRIAWLLTGFVLAVMLQNLTMAAACVLAATVTLQIRRTGVLVVLLAVGATQLDLSYFTQRLDFGAENQNLSTLVYLQGWQLIEEAWNNSAGIGLGFQQLGAQGSQVDAAQLIEAIMGEPLNLLDGGFTLAKLIGEFGYLGLALSVALLLNAWRSARELRKVASGTVPASPAGVFAHCAIVSYLLELFVRGAGYFTVTGLLLAMGLWLVAPQGPFDRKPVRARQMRQRGKQLSLET
jgi:hypothetical protein